QDSDVPQSPLFAIHVLGRGLEFYRPLVTHLKRSQLVYGLSTQIMDEALAPANQVEDLAAFYIKEMKRLQPEGPYFLTGVSFGGVVAFEMAQQLHSQGEKVALLALLDTYASVAIEPSTKGNSLFRLIELVKSGQADRLVKKIKMNLQGKIKKVNNYVLWLRCKFYQRLDQPLPTYLQDFV
ncbi:MAG: non-ribosomal peptide synthetase, partial [Microcoleus sp. SIO2G3]|nr:non-ribosomal peptide synthetase [Microcoleus sp. SIO2G3]